MPAAGAFHVHFTATMPDIVTRALRKVYPAPATKRRRGEPAPASSNGVVALALDLAVEAGEFFGLLA